MSLLVYGLNLRTAGVDLLERFAVTEESAAKALRSLMDRPHVSGAVVLSTCNRVEVYADVTRYHGGAGDLRAFFGEWGGVAPEDFAGRAYDHFDASVAAHLFTVAAGLDSVVVGERQILQQVRAALQTAETEGAAGRELGALFRHAVRAGRRAHAETALSQHAATLVDVGLEAAARLLPPRGDRGLVGLVLGAGAMGALAATRLARRSDRLLIVNRSPERGARLAARVHGEDLPLSHLHEGLVAADVVVASTGATEPVVSRAALEQAMALRADRPLVCVDLAVPRDLERGCGDLPGVTVLDVDGLQPDAPDSSTLASLEAARAIVADEVARFGAARQAVAVGPTIAALRDRAETVRAAELRRLEGRLAQLHPRERSAVEALTRRIVNTLLHEPTVRLKALAAEEGEAPVTRPAGPRSTEYSAMLHDLFDLDPADAPDPRG